MCFQNLKKNILFEPVALKNYLIPLLLAITAFLSYNNNFFLVTSDKLFLEHQLDSEQLVLDGILHRSEGNGPLKMGRYARPEINNQSILAHQLYADHNKDGEFSNYESQFGLQYYLFSFLAEILERDVRFLQAFSALLMSLIVVLFFIAIRREFSQVHAFFFCATLIFSPWVVIFARNLYWVEATWFLPTAITFLYGKRSLISGKSAIKMGALLFAAFLAKFLCGYEYLTTIALSACAPLAYYTMQYQIGLKRGLVQLVICGISLTLAFSAAVSLHMGYSSTSSDTAFNTISIIAKKRLATKDPSVAAKEFCNSSLNNEECEKHFVERFGKSLTSNRFAVIAKYFAMPHFLPWLDRMELNPIETATFKAAREEPSLESIRAMFSGIGFRGVAFLTSIIAFLLFNLFVCQAAIKQRSPLSLGLLVAIIAPLSWFFLAKAHSYVHYHLNYVLWYLVYIPFGMFFFLKRSNTLEARQ